jgi:hypothetical protein
MKAGEFKSVRAAAIEAGIVKRTITITLEPKAAAATKYQKRHIIVLCLLDSHER